MDVIQGNVSSKALCACVIVETREDFNKLCDLPCVCMCFSRHGITCTLMHYYTSTHTISDEHANTCASLHFNNLITLHIQLMVLHESQCRTKLAVRLKTHAYIRHMRV